jgi:hypothetical protein
MNAVSDSTDAPLLESHRGAAFKVLVLISAKALSSTAGRRCHTVWMGCTVLHLLHCKSKSSRVVVDDRQIHNLLPRATSTKAERPNGVRGSSDGGA